MYSGDTILTARPPIGLRCAHTALSQNKELRCVGNIINTLLIIIVLFSLNLCLYYNYFYPSSQHRWHYCTLEFFLVVWSGLTLLSMHGCSGLMIAMWRNRNDSKIIWSCTISSIYQSCQSLAHFVIVTKYYLQ